MLLSTLPENIETYTMVHRWLGFLLQHMDHNELSKLMKHYEKIGWLSEEAAEKLLIIAQGIKSSGTGTWQVPSRVHLTSLLFIAYISKREIPRELYSIDTYATVFTEKPEAMLSI